MVTTFKLLYSLDTEENVLSFIFFIPYLNAICIIKVFINIDRAYFLNKDREQDFKFQDRKGSPYLLKMYVKYLYCTQYFITLKVFHLCF